MSKKILLVMALMATLVSAADLLKPSNGQNSKEILTIQGTRRVYYQIEKKPLVYEITGPTRIKIYSRTAESKRTKDYIPFSFQVQIDEQVPVQMQHKQKLTNKVKSGNRPDYYYSRSAVDYLNIPAGKHLVNISRERRGQPVLLRVLDYDPKPSGSRKQLTPLEKAKPVKITAGDKNLKYYELSTAEPLYVNLDGPTNLELITRLAFETWMGREQDYRIQVWDSGKLLGTYYITGERSEVSTIEDQAELVPGKWRSIYVPLGKGSHEIKIRILDDDRRVFVKMNRIQE